MKKKLSGVQQRNKSKIAQANRRGACSSYTKDRVRERFMTPAYVTKKVHAKE